MRRRTPRGRRVPRLESTRSSSTSVRTARYQRDHRRGGESRSLREGAAEHADRVGKREPVGVLVGLPRGVVHHPAHGIVGQQQAVDFLAHEIGGETAQHGGAPPAQVGFDFVEDALVLPPLVVEGGEFRGRRLGGIEQRGAEPVDRLRVRDVREGVLLAVSGVAKVVPSKATRRRPRYHAPQVRRVASGRTQAAYRSRSTSQPRRVRAMEMAALPATAAGTAAAPHRARIPCCSQRSTSRVGSAICSPRAMTK